MNPGFLERFVIHFSAIIIFTCAVSVTPKEACSHLYFIQVKLARVLFSLCKWRSRRLL